LGQPINSTINNKGEEMKLSKTVSSLLVATAIFSNVGLMASDEIIEPTGLAQINEIIAEDERIARKATPEEIATAQQVATTMNDLIKEAIIERGLANDGWISVADAREINQYLVKNHAQAWENLRGEEGYALIERKASIVALANNAVKTVWGKIYNLGFEATNKGRNLSTYDDKKSSSFTTVGYYLGEVLKDDIASLQNPNFTEVVGTTGTKLDMIVNVILTDQGLLRKVSTGDLRIGAESADKMNALIIEGIKAKGLANDRRLTAADMRTLNQYLVKNHKERWAELHGDDEDNEETGYHKVQNDGAYNRIYADNVINSIADGIYHLGFETNNEKRLLNEDGNKNKSFEKVAWWLESSLKADLNAGKLDNPTYQEVLGETGTSLDKIIPYIYNDEGLLRKVSMEDIRVASSAANEMNKLLIEAIKTTGVASDDYISTDEVKELNQYLVTNHKERWAELHGDDEDDTETGYHRIQNDGALGVIHNQNTINKLADGIYHLGFETDNDKRLVNEDGNKNVSFKNVSYWLNKSLKTDYANGTLK